MDQLLEEPICCFSEINSDILTCVACLIPRDKFSNFDQFKLVRLAQFYPNDFSNFGITTFEYPFADYVLDL